jgi:hypothetical protein
MGRPAEIMQAELVEALAQRYGRLPREILAEDASLLKHLALASMAPQDEA